MIWSLYVAQLGSPETLFVDQAALELTETRLPLLALGLKACTIIPAPMVHF